MIKFFRILLVLLIPAAGFSQHLEAGILVGTSNYIGDLSNNSSNLYLGESKMAFGVLAKYNINYLFAVRAGLNYTKIGGRDSNVKNDDFVRMRNLSFQSKIIEFSLIGEVNIPGYQAYALSMPISPYLFGGISFFNYNPRTRYEGNWVELQGLGTEGQGMAGRDAKYKLSDISIPFGIGVKYALNDKINLGLELGARYALTDYLDDVGGTYVSYNELLAGNGNLAAALGNRTGELLENNDPIIVETGTQRGDLKSNDWYFILGLTVTYNFMDNGLMGSRGRSRRKAGCKTGF